MLRKLLPLFAAATALAAALPVQADVYKFKDENGNILYTDKPPTLPAERLNVRSQKTDVVAVQTRHEAEMKRLEELDKSSRDNAANRGEQQQAQELTAKDKADRCTKARERYDSVMNSQRLYEPLPNGERRYLTSQEIDAARASAKATMDVMCQ